MLVHPSRQPPTPRLLLLLLKSLAQPTSPLSHPLRLQLLLPLPPLPHPLLPQPLLLSAGPGLIVCQVPEGVTPGISSLQATTLCAASSVRDAHR